MEKLLKLLDSNNADYKIIKHDGQITNMEDAKKYFDVQKSAPIYLITADSELNAIIASAKSGHINYRKFGRRYNLGKISLANPDEIFARTGYTVGTIPPVGHGLPTYLDKQLLDNKYVYAGTGSPNHTLQIAVNDLLRLNDIVKIVDLSELG
jgi:prolyl-tRNA editing enzyme YbaK/EbsC (Cys-tRNA(Pro) deacylase)